MAFQSLASSEWSPLDGVPIRKGFRDLPRLISEEKIASYYLNIWHLNQMRKESNKRDSQRQNPFGCSCPEDYCSIVGQSSLKTSKPIHKKKPKKTRKPRIRRAPKGSTQRILLSKQIQKSTETHLTSSFPTRSATFELKTLVPSPSQDHVAEELKQIWGYVGQIGEHLLELEFKFPRPHLNYSVYFGPSQRVRCVSLMSSFCSKMGLKLETQFLAFEIFHRICTAPDFERYHSALKAAASIYVAAKYEEICAPPARLFTVLDPLQQVAPENIIKLEAKILTHLNFNLGLALPLHFAELLVLRYGLEKSSRNTLLQLCLHGMASEQLWMGGGSLLAMASMYMVSGSIPGWEQSSVEEELRWRVTLLQEIVGQ